MQRSQRAGSGSLPFFLCVPASCGSIAEREKRERACSGSGFDYASNARVVPAGTQTYTGLVGSAAHGGSATTSTSTP